MIYQKGANKLVYFPVLNWYPEYVSVYIIEYKRSPKLLTLSLYTDDKKKSTCVQFWIIRGHINWNVESARKKSPTSGQSVSSRPYTLQSIRARRR